MDFYKYFKELKLHASARVFKKLKQISSGETDAPPVVQEVTEVNPEFEIWDRKDKI